MATLDQARKIAWKQLVRISSSLPGGQVHKARWEISFPARNGTRATVGIYGCEKSGDHSRGDYLDGVLPAGHFGVKSAVRAFECETGLLAHGTLDPAWPSWYLIKPSA